MNNKVKMILYYVCALISGIILFVVTHIDDTVIVDSPLLKIISVVNIILVVLVTILLLIKRSSKNYRAVASIIYIIFSILMVIIMIFFSQKTRIPYSSVVYHMTLLLIGYTVLNIYTLLSFEKK